MKYPIVKVIKMDEPLVKEIAQEAKKENRTFSNMVRTLIMKALPRPSPRIKSKFEIQLAEAFKLNEEAQEKAKQK